MLRKPAWLKKQLLSFRDSEIKKKISRAHLNTVCSSARCPNRGECFGEGTATFLLLGDRCSRDCGFCNIEMLNKKELGKTDDNEPYRVARAIEEIGLDYVVLTSVTRDDLPDGGVSIFLKTIKEIRKLSRKLKIELLVPDFNGNEKRLKTLLDSDIVVFGHNIETVERLYPMIRKQADYRRSLEVLKMASIFRPDLRIKSGIMVGLGEVETELNLSFHDLFICGTDILTIGQYLMPNPSAYPVNKYIAIEEYEKYKKQAERAGIKLVLAAPFVRSSYHAYELYNRFCRKEITC